MSYMDDWRLKPLQRTLKEAEDARDACVRWMAKRESERKNYLDSVEYHERDKPLLDTLEGTVQALIAAQIWMK